MEDPSKWVEKDKSYDLEKHKTERIENGFSTFDWWNFSNYIAWVNVQALEKFKDGTGHPVDDNISSMDDWRSVLDKMIDGFKASESLSNMDYMDLDDTPEQWKAKATALQETVEAGMVLYAKYFQALWD